MVTLTDLTSLSNQTSVVSTINNNNDRIEDEFGNVLYKDGSVAVTGDIDVNGHRLLNLPTPEGPSDPVRLSDIEALDPTGAAAAVLRLELEGEDGATKIGIGDSTLDESVIPTVKQYGAKGDGVTDDTAAFVAAIAAEDELYVPPGTYMVDYMEIDKKIHIRISNSAIIKNRVPANPAVTLDAHWGIFKFVAGSDGSIVENGTLDGNRAALAPYYNGYTRLGQDNHWWGVRVEFADDVTIIGTRFQNFFYEGWYAINCDRFRALDVVIEDCGVAFQAQGLPEINSGWEIRATCKNIGNVIGSTAYYIFQHGLTIGLLENSNFQVTFEDYCASGLGVDGNSTSGGKEPVPIGMNIYSLDGCGLDLSIRNYTTIPAWRSIHQGLNFSSVNGCSGRLSSFGFEQAIAFNTSSDNSFDVDFDGDYVRVSAFPREGILMTFGGVAPPNGASLAGEAGSSLSSRGNVLRGTVRRFGIGVRDEGEDNDYSGLKVQGPVTDGIQLVRGTGTNAAYPLARTRPAGGRNLNGTTVTCAGWSGVIYTAGTGDRISGCYIRDNGQQIGSRTLPYNMTVLASTGEGIDLQIVDNDLDATPGGTVVNEYSFVPGTATAKSALKSYSEGTALTHVYDIVVRNGNNYQIGEILVLKNALAGPADATGKVVDIKEDTVTLAFASAVVFVDTGVLDTLTGTGSTSGINVTGVGTDFVNQVDFPMYLKNGSEYRRIVYVNSTTSAVINAPFTSNLSPGSSLQVVRGDIQTGTVFPEFALHVNANVTAGPMLLRDNIYHTINASINPASFTGIDRNSRWEQWYSLTMTGTALSNTIATGLPNYTQVSAVDMYNQTAITGVGGSVAVEIHQASAGALLKTAIAGASLGLDNISRGATPDAAAFGAFGGRVLYVSSSGNPTGTVRARLTLSKHCLG